MADQRLVDMIMSGDGKGANLYKANLHRADLRGADLADIDTLRYLAVH